MFLHRCAPIRHGDAGHLAWWFWTDRARRQRPSSAKRSTRVGGKCVLQGCSCGGTSRCSRSRGTASKYWCPNAQPWCGSEGCTVTIAGYCSRGKAVSGDLWGRFDRVGGENASHETSPFCHTFHMAEMGSDCQLSRLQRREKWNDYRDQTVLPRCTGSPETCTEMTGYTPVCYTHACSQGGAADDKQHRRTVHRKLVDIGPHHLLWLGLVDARPCILDTEELLELHLSQHASSRCVPGVQALTEIFPDRLRQQCRGSSKVQNRRGSTCCGQSDCRVDSVADGFDTKLVSGHKSCIQVPDRQTFRQRMGLQNGGREQHD